MFRFWFNDQLVFQVPVAVIVLSAFIVWLLYSYDVKKWIPLWLQIAWARICGWQVIQGDVHGDCNPLEVWSGKVWLIGNSYGGRTKPGVTAGPTAKVVVEGGVFGYQEPGVGYGKLVPNGTAVFGGPFYLEETNGTGLF